MSSIPKHRLSTEAYLALEEKSPYKNEYLAGEIWAIADASDAHVTITLNLALLLRQQLKASPCRVYITDMKVKIATANAFFYPDVFVSCEPHEQHNTLYKQQPIFIAEVLSPSTEAFDRGKKFAYYRQLDSLQHYWLIDSQSLAIDCFTRGNHNDWILHTANSPEQVLTLDKLPGQYAMQAIYDDVAFEDFMD